jgi:hypothetical protein
MDFGKKGDAKKAMKLMWKEGITLKQAWKRVKSGKSSKKSSKMSPKKKRAVANAKKAMKLKWKDGITLKQAWANVNRFGDTVCPPGKEPNTWWAGRKGQRECIDECKYYQARNPATNRCKNIIVPSASSLPGPPSAWMTGRPSAPLMSSSIYEINPNTGRRRRRCDPPNFRNVKGNCVTPLLSGYEINPETGRRRRIIDPQTEYRDPISGKIKKISRSGLPSRGFSGVSSLPLPPPEATFSSLSPLAAEFFMPPTNVFGKRNTFGGRKCGFGSCKSCNLIM